MLFPHWSSNVEGWIAPWRLTSTLSQFQASCSPSWTDWEAQIAQHSTAPQYNTTHIKVINDLANAVFISPVRIWFCSSHINLWTFSAILYLHLSKSLPHVRMYVSSNDYITMVQWSSMTSIGGLWLTISRDRTLNILKIFCDQTQNLKKD